MLDNKAVADFCYKFDKKSMSGQTVVSFDETIEINKVIRYWHITQTLIQVPGEKPQILGIATDISKLKKANEELEIAKNKAETADKIGRAHV